LDAVAALRRYPVLKNRTLEARSRAVIGNRSSTDFCGEAQGDELAHRRTVGVGRDGESEEARVAGRGPVAATSSADRSRDLKKCQEPLPGAL
jgi:hypothetical protein